MNFWDTLNKFGDSLQRLTSEKLTSPFWLPYLTIFLIIYWKVVYIWLFIDTDTYSESINKFKGIKEALPGKITLGILPDTSIMPNWIFNFLVVTILVFIFYVFQKFIVNDWSYRIKNWSRKKFIDEEFDIIKKEEATIKTKEKLSNRWDQRYEDLFQTKFGAVIEHFPRWFEEFNGNYMSVRGIISSEALAYLKGEGIVERNENNPNFYSLTEAGRYILSKYLKRKYGINN